MAEDRPLPIRAGRIRLDAPYFTRFLVQTSGAGHCPGRLCMHRIIDPPKDQWDLLPTPLTSGERQIAVLFDANLPSEWEMYVQPHLNGLRPDLVSSQSIRGHRRI